MDTLPGRASAELHGLSAEERIRADRFRDGRARERYIRRRLWLRQQLARQLSCSPTQLQLDVDSYGKPFLADKRLGFNMSSSKSLALLVMGPIESIGCDVEYEDPRLDPTPIVEAHFAKQEQRAYHALPENHRLAAFYHAWTCKEAFAKAIGVGLSLELDAFVVEIDPNKPARLLSGCGNHLVRSFTPAAGFRAAIVAPGDWMFKVASR